MSTITKLSPSVTQYYKNITSPIGANVRIQGDIQVWIVQKEAQSHNRKTLEPSRGPERIGLWTVCRWSTLPLRNSDQQPEESTRSKLQDLDMRIQGSQNSPASSDANAKWRALISIRVSINLNHMHAFSTVSWTQTYVRKKRDSRWYQVGNMHGIIW